MKTIELANGRGIALVDDEDVEVLSVYYWRITAKGYACRNVVRNGVRTTETMHRAILAAPSGYEVDHINMNKLDNRRCNLRLATSEQNKWNRIATRNCKSKYKGVFWHSAGNNWESRIRADRVRRYLGQFDSEIDAALAYDSAARLHFGEFARLNFPLEGERVA